MVPEEKLANAIIQQAANDYKRVLRGQQSNDYNKHELENFFHSQWFEELTSCDGEYLMKFLCEGEKQKKKNKSKGNSSSYITMQYEANLQKEA